MSHQEQGMPVCDLVSTVNLLSPLQQKQMKRLTTLLKRKKRLWESIPTNGPANTVFYSEPGVILGHRVNFHRLNGQCVDVPSLGVVSAVSVQVYLPKLDLFYSFHYNVTNKDGTNLDNFRSSQQYTCVSIAKFHSNDIANGVFDNSDNLEDFIEKVQAAKLPRDLTRALF